VTFVLFFVFFCVCVCVCVFFFFFLTIKFADCGEEGVVSMRLTLSPPAVKTQ
jgi:hypothetical protein